MHLINSIGKFYFSTRLGAIDRFIASSVETQYGTLSYLLDKATDTEFGKKYCFGEIRDYETFRAAVPLQDYESHKPFFARMQQGHRDVLWPGACRWFAKSSGTTNDASKFIPVSTEGLHQSHIKTGKDFLSIYLRNKPQSRFFTGKGIVMGGSYHNNESNPDIFVGDVSAILMKNLDTWIQYFREPGLDVALMNSWEQKLEKIAAVTIGQNITNISGVPSWTLLLLKRILDKTGKKSIGEVWPHLELYCHGGVGFAPYRQQFEELIGRAVTYQNIYNASEGFFAFQDTLDQEAMLLHTDNGVFYEFIPFNGSLDIDHVVTLEGVQKNQNYALAISTNSGLWRYVIGDTVEFMEIAPYRIRITGRTKHYVNVFGEEVTVDNTDRALAAACEEADCIVADYTVAPVYMGSGRAGRHHWAIEFSRAPLDMAAFETLLDRKLQSLNTDYQAKRSGSLAMDKLTILPLPKGTFYKWLESRERLSSQQKVPRLYNDCTFMDQIKKVSETIK
jgi:hypothetical protein